MNVSGIMTKDANAQNQKNTVNPLTKNAVNIIPLELDMLVLTVNTQLVSQQNVLAINPPDLKRLFLLLSLVNNLSCMCPPSKTANQKIYVKQNIVYG
jgi:hypothetical protein